MKGERTSNTVYIYINGPLYSFAEISRVVFHNKRRIVEAILATRRGCLGYVLSAQNTQYRSVPTQHLYVVLAEPTSSKQSENEVGSG